ncbi:hypothetical protein AHAS_Ahas13G0308600 [Arachis hypogaea]
MGSTIGHMLKIDHTTLIYSRGLHQICFSYGKYGDRLDHCNETPMKEPASQVNAGGEEENINSDNQNHVDFADQNGKSHDSYNQSVPSNNQDPPCFGPSINEEDNQGKEHWSRFNALQEESALITLEGEPHVEGKSSSITNNWASPNKAQKEKANLQPIKKKVLKQGAGKNPQMGKKPLSNKVGPTQNEKLVKSIPKATTKPSSSLVATPKNVPSPTPKSKDPEFEAMEGVVMNYMRRLGREQYEADVAAKKVKIQFEDYAICSNPMIASPSTGSSSKPMELGYEPGENVRRAPDDVKALIV